VGYDNERSKGDHRHIGGGSNHTNSRMWRRWYATFSRMLSAGGRSEESDDSNSKECGCRAQEDGRAVRQSVEERQIGGRHFGIRVSRRAVSRADPQALGADRTITGTWT